MPFLTIAKPQLELMLSSESLPKIKRGRLPTNTTTRNHAVHRWYNFIAGFSPEFVSECIEALSPATRSTLLDPFSGCATAQVEGMRYKMQVIGYEPHPVFHKIARAKTNLQQLIERTNSIGSAIKKGLDQPVDPSCLGEKPEAFLTKLFDRGTLARLVGAREVLRHGQHYDDDLAFLILSKVLDYTSHSQTDGIYKAPTSKKRAADPVLALQKVISMLEEDALVAGTRWSEAKVPRLYRKSSQEMSDVSSNTVDIVVTSPPYLNNFDFAEMTRMHLYFWSMARSWGEITNLVRSRLIVNTTTALSGHKELQDYYRAKLPSTLHISLGNLVSALREERRNRAGKKEYDYIVYPYFSQMAESLEETLRVMRKGAHFHMMVADAALYGIHISTPQMIAHLMHDLGFQSINLAKVRERGERWILQKRDGSETGLGEYHISAVK